MASQRDLLSARFFPTSYIKTEREKIHNNHILTNDGNYFNDIHGDTIK